MWIMLRKVAEVWCHAEQSAAHKRADMVDRLSIFVKTLSGEGVVTHVLQWAAGRVPMAIYGKCGSS